LAIEHPIEHATGLYTGLLLLACTVGAVTKRFAHVPYTIALTLLGLAIAYLPFSPRIEETGFSKDLIFFVMLPPLLFQGALHMNLNRLLGNIAPIATYALLGVLLSTFVIGGICHWLGGMEVFLVALLFGAMISPTDPVSVLAIFKEANVPPDLRYIVEGESLFNDGVGVVIFTIIFDLIARGGDFSAGTAVFEFAKVAAGGLLLGVVIGFAVFLILRPLTDHLLENAFCLVAAYGAFWLGEVIHVSGVIACVVAGLMVGNYGRRLSMSQKTTETVETFFESIDFLINSLLFILIGLELQTIGKEEWLANLRPLLVGIAAFLIARAVVVYPLYHTLNLAGTKRPHSWSHVIYWGGLRGSIPIALLLGSMNHESLAPHRSMLLVAGFGVVVFSLLGQGLTMKPLIKLLGVGGQENSETPAPAE
jgi:CPA1 family monovalent cation:H+ antiporter